MPQKGGSMNHHPVGNCPSQRGAGEEAESPAYIVESAKKVIWKDDVCNEFCSDYADFDQRMKTTILPEFWRCKYHSFLQSISMRVLSSRRPRMVIEVVAPLVTTIIVAIGDRYETEVRLPKDLEYIVYRRLGCYTMVYDHRKNSIIVITDASDEALLNRRLRYDLFLALKHNGYKQVRKESELIMKGEEYE
jgi:hypothetical protein